VVSNSPITKGHQLAATPTWPRKTREYQNHHMDSTIWNEFQFRNNDIVIATYAKSGTTWVQQIAGQLLFNGRPDLDVANMSPWLDLRFPSKKQKLEAVDAQTHRRFLKTHLPVNALVFSPQAKYVYIARDGRDVVWSLYNHHANANEAWYRAINDTPDRVGPPICRPSDSIETYFQEWLNGDGYPFWPFWENIRSWWNIRHLPNVLLLHFENLRRDLPGQIRQLASFLEISIDETRWADILLHCSFDYMKKHATKSVPLGGVFWDGGSETFIHKGTNGRWRETLSAFDSAKYEYMAQKNLGRECSFWLKTGEV
jgi:aryl sulfotransferase